MRIRIGWLLPLPLLSACTLNLTPEIQLLDRPTLMEAEAAGHWPDLESKLMQQLQLGPEALSEVPDARRERLFRILNGEFPSAAAEVNDVVR